MLLCADLEGLASVLQLILGLGLSEWWFFVPAPVPPSVGFLAVIPIFGALVFPRGIHPYPCRISTCLIQEDNKPQ